MANLDKQADYHSTIQRKSIRAIKNLSTLIFKKNQDGMTSDKSTDIFNNGDTTPSIISPSTSLTLSGRSPDYNSSAVKTPSPLNSSPSTLERSLKVPVAAPANRFSNGFSYAGESLLSDSTDFENANYPSLHQARSGSPDGDYHELRSHSPMGSNLVLADKSNLSGAFISDEASMESLVSPPSLNRKKVDNERQYGALPVPSTKSVIDSDSPIPKHKESSAGLHAEIDRSDSAPDFPPIEKLESIVRSDSVRETSKIR